MGIFDGVEDAKFSGGGSYFSRGTYLVRIDATKVIESAMGKGTFVAIEGTVVETLAPMYEESDNLYGRPHPASCTPGFMGSQLIKMSQPSAMGNVRNAMEAIARSSPSDGGRTDGVLWYSEGFDLTQFCERAVSGDGTKFAGTIVKLRCGVVNTRQELSPNTRGRRWAPPRRRMPPSGNTGALDGPPFFCHQGRTMTTRTTPTVVGACETTIRRGRNIPRMVCLSHSVGTMARGGS